MACYAVLGRAGHSLGMGKEILLMFWVAKTGFPSGSKLGTEVLRMHELQTCEIPLLRRFGSTVWSAAPPVCAMPPHLDGAPEKAGAASASDNSGLAASRTGGRLQSFTTLLQATGSGAAGVSVSISPSNAAVRFPACSTEDSPRTPGASCRRSMVPVRRRALGPLLDGPQAVQRRLRDLPGSHAAARQGRRYSLAEGHGGYPAGGHAPNSRHGRG